MGFLDSDCFFLGFSKEAICIPNALFSYQTLYQGMICSSTALLAPKGPM